MTNENKGFLAIIGLVVLLVSVSGCTYTPPGTGTGDTSLTKVKERGLLIVGTSATYPPMEFTDELGNIVGFDADLANEIASSMGVSLEILDYEWNSLFDAVKEGEIDIAISSMTITPERSNEMLFSIPYFNGGQVMIVVKGYDGVESPEDLSDKKVGVQSGTTCEDAAKVYTDPDTLSTFEDSVDVVSHLLDGTVDVVIMDYVAAVGYRNENPSLEIIGNPFTQEFYGIPTEISNIALKTEIDNILRDLKRTGKLDELGEKWLD
jgi:polar amino acid transport system substrate-binding protein